MVLYKCNRCSKEFKNKYDHNRHKNRKFPCTKLNPNESKLNPSESKTNALKSDTCEIQKNNESKSESKNFALEKRITDYECFFCQNYYSTNSNLNKHMNRIRYNFN